MARAFRTASTHRTRPLTGLGPEWPTGSPADRHPDADDRIDSPPDGGFFEGTIPQTGTHPAPPALVRTRFAIWMAIVPCREQAARAATDGDRDAPHRAAARRRRPLDGAERQPPTVRCPGIVTDTAGQAGRRKAGDGCGNAAIPSGGAPHRRRNGGAAGPTCPEPPTSGTEPRATSSRNPSQASPREAAEDPRADGPEPRSGYAAD